MAEADDFLSRPIPYSPPSLDGSNEFNLDDYWSPPSSSHYYDQNNYFNNKTDPIQDFLAYTDSPTTSDLNTMPLPSNEDTADLSLIPTTPVSHDLRPRRLQKIVKEKVPEEDKLPWPRARANKVIKKEYKVSGKVRAVKKYGQQKPKQKMYLLNTPEAKGARASRLNREKKKFEMQILKNQNTNLKATLQSLVDFKMELTKKAADLQVDLAMLQNNTPTSDRVFRSAKDLIEAIMPPLNTKYGTLSPTGPFTRSYVTLSISAVENLVDVEYNYPDFENFR